MRHDTNHAEAVRLAKRAHDCRIKDPAKARRYAGLALKLVGYSNQGGR